MHFVCSSYFLYHRYNNNDYTKCLLDLSLSSFILALVVWCGGLAKFIVVIYFLIIIITDLNPPHTQRDLSPGDSASLCFLFFFSSYIYVTQIGGK